MAQLYKMTLYVCDLEDGLSLDEIETLIEQDALNSIYVNCVCHFADSQIGQNVEWDDDIDLNRCDCPTSAWDKYFALPTKKKTNADRVRSMNDEELAEFIKNIKVRAALSKALKNNDAFEKLCSAEWLKQPCERRMNDDTERSN